jgi:hypothetical protein
VGNIEGGKIMAKNTRRGTTANPDIQAIRNERVTVEQLLNLALEHRFSPGFDRNSMTEVPVTVRPRKTRLVFGPPVLRSADFLNVEIALFNLNVLPPKNGKGPASLAVAGRGNAYIVLRFPPQSISEQVFYQTPGSNLTEKDAHSDKPTPPSKNGNSEEPPDHPIQARIAKKSRIVFRYDKAALASAGIDAVNYTLEGILDACRYLPLSIAPNARHKPVVRLVFGGKTDIMRSQQRTFGKLSAVDRATVLSNALQNLQLIARHGSDAAGLILRRAELSSESLNEHLPTNTAAKSRAPATTLASKSMTTTGTTGAVSLHGPAALAAIGALHSSRLQIAFLPSSIFGIELPRPTDPLETETTLELPYRLVLSPNESGRFLHETAAVASPATGCTPLWHSRLGRLDDETGKVVEGPGSGTEIRAIWARVGPESDPDHFNGQWSNREHAQHPEHPDPSTLPFRSTLDDRDRFNIVHLSSNFTIADGNQEAIECRRLMLSALGGWLDLRGAWKVPAGLSVEEWIHQATQARDHYVKVVYKGYLLPFGHRASLVKVSERKFHHDHPDNPAYLRQRMFLIIREPVREFPTMGVAGSAPLPGPGGSTPFTRYYHRQFPFASVRILDRVTPDLVDPATTDFTNVTNKYTAETKTESSQLLFWPCVVSKDEPFRFSYVGTDLDGNQIKFQLPAIFMDNEWANPAGEGSVRNIAEGYFAAAQEAYLKADETRRTADMQRQRVTLAVSGKPGDTACEIERMIFGAEVDQLKFDLKTRNGPLIYPTMQKADVRIPSLAYLAGGEGTNTVSWNRAYVAQPQDFGPGEVFLDVQPGGAALDFTKQGNRSGGFVQPNLAPSGISRLSGPISGNVDTFGSGSFDGTDFFSSLSPLLFGCIPLGEVISAFGIDKDSLGKLPKFVAEAANIAQNVFGALGQMNDLTGTLETLAKSAVEAVIKQAVASAMHELRPQIEALDATTAAIAAQIQAVEDAATTVIATVEATAGILKNPSGLLTALDPLTTAVPLLLNATNNRISALPGSALSPAVQNVVKQQLTPILARLNQIQSIIADIQKLPDLLAAAEKLATDIAAFLVPPDLLEALLKNEADLESKLTAIDTALNGFAPLMEKIDLLDGGLKKTVLDIARGLGEITSKAAEIAPLLSSLVGDEITVRFAWQPEVDPWPASGNPLYGALGTLFKPNDKKAFIISVEAKVKKSSGEAKAKVLCALRNFDLILLGEKNAFMGLAFERIEFTADSSLKMNVDVVLDAIHFLGPLSFVEALKDLIPLDGFSDPPSLKISAQGIDAGFSIALPNLAIGVFNLSNLSLGAGFTVPFIGQPLSVRFNFCTREQPFCLTVAMFGGGGFFGLTVDPHGVQLLEAALEFGAAIAIDFGVASGGVHVMAGIYFRMEQDACSLTGYFRLGGEVEVLCIISASLELYLALTYQFETGKCAGEATLTISVSVFMFSVSVSVHCERQFAGSNGDPPFELLMGPDGPLTLTAHYPWRDYVEAFA